MQRWLGRFVENFSQVFAGFLFILLFAADMIGSMAQNLILNYIIYIAISLITILFLLKDFVTKEVRAEHKELLLILFAWLVIISLTQKPWIQPNYFLGPIIAIYFYTRLPEKQFIAVLILILAVSTSIEIYETLRGEYFYNRIAAAGMDSVELNADFFSGLRDVFRAKGIFDGPLTSAFFCILAVFAVRKKSFTGLIAFVAVAFSQARLGILLVGLLLALRWSDLIFAKEAKSKFLRYLIIVVGLASVIYLMKSIVDLDFLKGALSKDDEGNAGRLETYVFMWDHFIATAFDGIKDFTRLVFGEAGYIRSIFDNSAENSFLQLLGDIGLIGMILYVSSYNKFIGREGNPKRDFEKFLLIAFCFSTPAVEKLYLNVLLWVVAFRWVGGGVQPTNSVLALPDGESGPEPGCPETENRLCGDGA